MTGHDLDLDAIKADLTVRERISGTESYAENLAVIHGERSGTTIGDADRRVLTIHAPALVAEVESLRAKLAAAEQERDRLRGDVERAQKRADAVELIEGRARGLAQERAVRAEVALVAVRELVEREKRERGGRATPWTFVAELEAALAAAEQPEPTPEQP